MRFIDRLNEFCMHFQNAMLVEKQLKFLHNNQSLIIRECYKNEGKTGYLHLIANKEFQLIGNSVEFIPGDFNPEEFFFLGPIKPMNQEPVKKSFFIYYSIFWWDPGITWNLKDHVLLLE